MAVLLYLQGHMAELFDRETIPFVLQSDSVPELHTDMNATYHMAGSATYKMIRTMLWNKWVYKVHKTMFSTQMTCQDIR